MAVAMVEGIKKSVPSGKRHMAINNITPLIAIRKKGKHRSPGFA